MKLLFLLLIPSLALAQPPALQIGVVSSSYTNATVAVGNGSSYAVSTIATQVTWQTTFASSPISITVQLQASLDNTNWSAIDSTTSPAGEIKTTYTSANFIRCAITASSGGSGITCSIIAKFSPIAAIPATGVGQIISTDAMFGNNVAPLLPSTVAINATVNDFVPIEIHNETFGSTVWGYVHNNSAGQGPAFNLSRSRGTRASPTGILANDYIGQLVFTGYNPTDVAYNAAFSLLVTAKSDFTGAGVRPALVTFGTGANQSLLTFDDTLGSIFGSTGLATRTRTTGATPGTLVNGDCWFDTAAGNWTTAATTINLKCQNNGVTRTVASVTF